MFQHIIQIHWFKKKKQIREGYREGRKVSGEGDFTDGSETFLLSSDNFILLEICIIKGSIFFLLKSTYSITKQETVRNLLEQNHSGLKK